MPKAIKKKVTKGSEVAAEDSLRTFMSTAAERIERNRNRFIIAVVAVLAVIIAASAFYYLRTTGEEKSDMDMYIGYKTYYGLYDAKAIPDADRYQRALESFKKSYGEESSPQALMFMADSQEKLGQYDDALATLAKIERDYVGNDVFVPLAIYKTAMIQIRAGKKDDALKTLERLYDSKAPIYRDMALVEEARMLEDMGKHEESLTKYNTIISEFPESPFLDEARMKTGKDKEGVENAVTSGSPAEVPTK